MRFSKWIVIGLATTSWLGVAGSPSRADEKNEIRERISMLRAKIQELNANGLHDQANALKQETEELLGALKRSREASPERGEGSDQHPDSDRNQRREPAPAREEAKTMERGLRERMEMVEKQGQRLQHTRAAAENLKHAEMHDMARELMHRADEMEAVLRHEKESLQRDRERMQQRVVAVQDARPGKELRQAMQERAMQEREQQAMKEAINERHERERSHNEMRERAMREEMRERAMREVNEEIGAAMRQLRQENEAMRQELRELAKNMERIGAELKRRSKE
jgi:hypothetical protein